MLAANPGPRIIMCTFEACADRNTAACPAELPAPQHPLAVGAHLGLETRGPVPDAVALELLDAAQRGPAVARAAGAHQAAAAQAAAVGEVDGEEAFALR